MCAHSVSERELGGKGPVPDSAQGSRDGDIGCPNGSYAAYFLAKEMAGDTPVWAQLEKIFPVLSAGAKAGLSPLGIELAVQGADMSDGQVQRFLAYVTWKEALEKVYYDYRGDGKPFNSMHELNALVTKALPAASALVIDNVRQIKEAGAWPEEWWPEKVEDLEALLNW